MGNRHSSDATNHTCPVHDLNENATQKFISNMTFFTFNKILSGSCAAFATIVIFGLLFMHATHLSKPTEQIKMMKIGLLIPFYSILSVLSICFPKAAVYIAPWLDVVQSFALGSFFLMMCEFVSESPTQREMFFAALVVKDKNSQGAQVDGILWYRRRWLLIFQYPVVSLLVAVLTAITQAAGIYCRYLSKPYFAKLWLTLAKDASLVLAVISVLKFYFALKSHLTEHKPLSKLLAFKLVVGFTFIINIVWWILTDTHILNPTSRLTYSDLNIGIPNMIICILMVPLSVFFHYAYSYRPYLISRHSTNTTMLASGEAGPQPERRYYGGFMGGKAWLRAFNPVETAQAIIFAFTMALEDRENGIVKAAENMNGNGGPKFGGAVQGQYGSQEYNVPQRSDRRSRHDRHRRFERY